MNITSIGSFLLESTLFLFEHRFLFLASSADFKLYQTLYILGHLRLSLHYFYLNTVSFTWRVRQKYLCKQIISTLYQTFYILRYLHLLQHYFCLNTVCFTWRVRHKYLCKLEQHQGIPWATRSVSEQCICWTSYPSNTELLLAFTQVIMSNIPTVCYRLYTVCYCVCLCVHFTSPYTARHNYLQ